MDDLPQNKEAGPSRIAGITLRSHRLHRPGMPALCLVRPTNVLRDLCVCHSAVLKTSDYPGDLKTSIAGTSPGVTGVVDDVGDCCSSGSFSASAFL